MPQGEGTYGSKVGRPSKKKYKDGGVVGAADEAALEAAQMGQELEAIPVQKIEPEFPIESSEPEIPEFNAMDRSQVSPMGDEVGTGLYKEGGKVKRKKPIYNEMIKKAEESGRVGSKAQHAAMSISRAHHGADFRGKKADITSVVKALKRTKPKKKG
jgi:hypothetical protein